MSFAGSSGSTMLPPATTWAVPVPLPFMTHSAEDPRHVNAAVGRINLELSQVWQRNLKAFLSGLFLRQEGDRANGADRCLGVLPARKFRSRRRINTPHQGRAEPSWLNASGRPSRGVTLAPCRGGQAFLTTRCPERKGIKGACDFAWSRQFPTNGRSWEILRTIYRAASRAPRPSPGPGRHGRETYKP